jgi:acyl-[acyl-carrier-protein] desaturase
LLGDEHGRRLMARVAGDEALHHVFYRDAMAALIELDPNESVLAIDRVVRSFAMPGTGIADFKSHSKAIAITGIYDFSSHYASVLVPVVINAWKLDEIAGLDDDGERARDRCLAYIAKVGRVADRMTQQRAELASVS